MSEIKAGQEWEEVDPRHSRQVKVLEVREGEIKSVKIANSTGRATWASKARFNGKRGGYKLVRDV